MGSPAPDAADGRVAANERLARRMRAFVNVAGSWLALRLDVDTRPERGELVYDREL